MTIQQKALEYALNEIKNKAIEVGNNNSGPFVEKYLNNLGNSGDSWCASFISWCFLQASNELNVQMPFKYNLSAKSMFNEFKKNKKTKINNPNSGDLIFFWRKSPISWEGHVGIIKEVKNNSITTIEGNVGNYPAKVKEIIYTINNYNFNEIPKFLGFGYFD